MARGKVARGTRTQNARVEQPVSEGIRRAAERAGIKAQPPLDTSPVTLPRHEIDRINRLLTRAADSALNGAYQPIPTLRGRFGPVAAIDAVRDIKAVRELLAAATGGAR